ncbi:hypothetical protein, partial [Methylobrevis pamukkalensis]|uniref:hypothetical protein n=1 Tax=Methylobrevis pamukkalensis TaxID=1439726 RepID=UPI00114C8B5C
MADEPLPGKMEQQPKAGRIAVRRIGVKACVQIEAALHRKREARDRGLEQGVEIHGRAELRHRATLGIGNRGVADEGRCRRQARGGGEPRQRLAVEARAG